MTLKIGSRSPNSDQIVYLSQLYNTWSLFWIHHLVQEAGSKKAFVVSNLTFKVPIWPWKWGQGHQNQINFCPCPKGVSVQVWSKSIYWFRRSSAEKAHFYSLYSVVTLKIRSRSPKSNLLTIPMIQYANFGQKLSFCSRDRRRQAVLVKMWHSKCWCDLENEVTVTEI